VPGGRRSLATLGMAARSSSWATVSRAKRWLPYRCSSRSVADIERGHALDGRHQDALSRFAAAPASAWANPTDQRDLAERAGVSAARSRTGGRRQLPDAERSRQSSACARSRWPDCRQGGLAEAREIWAAAQPRSATDAHAVRRTVVRPTPYGAEIRGPRPTWSNARGWGDAPDPWARRPRDDWHSAGHWVLEERCRLVHCGHGRHRPRPGWRPAWPMTCPPASSASTGGACVTHHLRASGWPAPSASCLTTAVPPSAESERIAVLLQLLRERAVLVVLDISRRFRARPMGGSYRAGVPVRRV